MKTASMTKQLETMHRGSVAMDAWETDPYLPRDILALMCEAPVLARDIILGLEAAGDPDLPPELVDWARSALVLRDN